MNSAKELHDRAYREAEAKNRDDFYSPVTLGTLAASVLIGSVTVLSWGVGASVFGAHGVGQGLGIEQAYKQHKKDCERILQSP